MSELCNCDEGQEEHEHCQDCDCILKCNESEKYCCWCEERRADGSMSDIIHDTNNASKVRHLCVNLDQVELRQQYNWLCNIVPSSDEQEGLLNLIEHLLEERTQGGMTTFQIRDQNRSHGVLVGNYVTYKQAKSNLWRFAHTGGDLVVEEVLP